MCTAHRKIVAGEKLANFENPALFAKIFRAIIHRYTKNAFGICTECNLFANFFLTNTSYLYGLPKFSHVRYLYLYLNTSKSACIYLSTSPKTMPCTCTCTSTNVKVLVLYLSTFTCTSRHACLMDF